LETSVPRRTIGVFFFDAADRLDFRLLDRWEEFEDAEYLSSLAADFQQKIGEMGGGAFLRWMEDTLSNFLLISEREPAGNKSIDDLFEEHVDSRVRPYETHLPFYSLRAAATKFGEENEVTEESWVRVGGLRLTEAMFVARVVGRSMEPLIPDGSLCVFRAPVVGSRQGKRLLIEQFGATDNTARYTVKRYTSTKTHSGEEWEHASIRLEPLNPEFEAFELPPDQCRVIAEFVKVLE
jgi:SOS-response transcriptional repressor LexA